MRIWKRKKKSERTPRQIAKDDAWKAFSLFIRTRDCLLTTGNPGLGRCYTCGNLKPFKGLQAGHFISGRGNAVLFDEKGVKAQCVACNYFKGGEPLKFRRRLVEEIGEEEVSALEMKRHTTMSRTIGEFDAIRDYYIEEYKKLGGV